MFRLGLDKIFNSFSLFVSSDDDSVSFINSFDFIFFLTFLFKPDDDV